MLWMGLKKTKEIMEAVCTREQRKEGVYRPILLTALKKCIEPRLYAEKSRRA